jgi:hypothetical protein
VANTRGPGPKPPLTPILDGFGKPDSKRDAAVSEYGKQLGDVELELLDEPEDPAELARRAAGRSATASAGKPAAPPVSTLEPISEDTHKHRRIPTQPPMALELALDDHERPPPERPVVRPTTIPPGAPASSPSLASRQSPAPVRRGLFSGDRITNMLASAAVGVLVMIFPAKQLAHSYEVRTVEPLLAELDGAIDHPLGVQAGLVAEPEKIAAQIHEGREKVRHRYMAIWLLVGLPLGLGLGLVPRPGD